MTEDYGLEISSKVRLALFKLVRLALLVRLVLLRLISLYLDLFRLI